MIRLTLLDGSPTLINPLAVFSVVTTDCGTMIWSTAGTPCEVRETLDAIEIRFRAWTKG